MFSEGTTGVYLKYDKETMRYAHKGGLVMNAKPYTEKQLRDARYLMCARCTKTAINISLVIVLAMAFALMVMELSSGNNYSGAILTMLYFAAAMSLAAIAVSAIASSKKAKLKEMLLHMMISDIHFYLKSAFRNEKMQRDCLRMICTILDKLITDCAMDELTDQVMIKDCNCETRRLRGKLYTANVLIHFEKVRQCCRNQGGIELLSREGEAVYDEIIEVVMGEE